MKDNENICSTNCPNSPHDAVPCVFEELTLSKGHPSAAAKDSKCIKAFKPDVTQQPHVVNGCLNHNKDKSTSAIPARSNRKQRSKLSAAGCVFINGTTSDGCGLSTSRNPGTKHGHPLTITSKKKRRRNKKRMEVHTNGRLKSTPFILSQQPPEEEDWEKECQDNLEKRFSLQPYGPEDICVVAFHDLTLDTGKTIPGKAGYNPALQHPDPLPFSCSGVTAEPEQFADADE